MNDKVAKARDAVKNAGALLVTAGAGMGVDSGLPDFRGNEGFWNAYPEARKRGLSFSEMANPEWFHTDPALAWAFYGHRFNLYRDTVPHEGFGALLGLGESLPGGYFVFTSNVDGQFQKAGFDDARIEEVHGSIHHFQCLENCSDRIWPAHDEKIDVDMTSFTALEFPRCPSCGSLARPNILMFGDWGWNEARSYAQSSRFGRWLENVMDEGLNLVVVEIGAGEAIPTVRMKSERVAAVTGGTLIRINPRDEQMPSGINGVGLPMGGLEGIMAIL
jgi:NAD-dependent SIR2 family protein deacetylase